MDTSDGSDSESNDSGKKVVFLRSCKIGPPPKSPTFEADLFSIEEQQRALDLEASNTKLQRHASVLEAINIVLQHQTIALEAGFRNQVSKRRELLEHLRAVNARKRAVARGLESSLKAQVSKRRSSLEHLRAVHARKRAVVALAAATQEHARDLEARLKAQISVASKLRLWLWASTLTLSSTTVLMYFVRHSI